MVGMKRVSVVMLDSAFKNLQRREEALSALPPLEGVWLDWIRHQVRASTAGMRSLFSPGMQVFDPTTLSGVDIHMLTASLTHGLGSLSLQEPHSPWECRPLLARLLRHDGQLCAAEQRQALLTRGTLTHVGRESVDDLSAIEAVFHEREVRRCQS